jgi:hypothetical protein
MNVGPRKEPAAVAELVGVEVVQREVRELEARGCIFDICVKYKGRIEGCGEALDSRSRWTSIWMKEVKVSSNDCTKRYVENECRGISD